MPSRQRGTAAWSMPDAARHRVRLSGVTVPRQLLERVRGIAGPVRGELSRAVEVALYDWCERREAYTAAQKATAAGEGARGSQESNDRPE